MMSIMYCESLHTSCCLKGLRIPKFHLETPTHLTLHRCARYSPFSLLVFLLLSVFKPNTHTVKETYAECGKEIKQKPQGQVYVSSRGDGKAGPAIYFPICLRLYCCLKHTDQPALSGFLSPCCHGLDASCSLKMGDTSHVIEEGPLFNSNARACTPI